MKNFDEARQERQRKITEEDRTFVIGGETFVAKREVHPSVLTGYDRLNEDTSITETLEIVDDAILGMIENRDNAHGRYLDIRSRDDSDEDFVIITVEDLLDLVRWLMEVQTGRPTGQPSGSASGRKPTATASTDDSSSPATPQASRA